MGTNFYMMTKNKELAQKYAPYSYELTDEPEFGYSIHVAKTSMGWLPSFQGHKDGIQSVKEYKEAYDAGEFIIYDEYGTIYTWEEFDERVLQFNGGTVKNRKIEKINQDKTSRFYDPAMPDHIPVSHFEYNYNLHHSWYEVYKEHFKDKDGYEFTWTEFS